MLNRLESFILDINNIDRKNFIWNIVASISNSFQSMLLMLILTRQGNVEGASYIAIGFAVANLLMTIGKFGVRNYQVTDVEEKYDFSTYFRLRFVTVSAMILGCVVYGGYNMIFKSYTLNKLIVVELVCLYKIIESIEDVYHGRLQQKGLLCIASKIWSIRSITFIVEFFVIYWLTQDVLVTLLVDVITSMVLALGLNSIPKEKYGIFENTNKKQIFGLMYSCVAIAIATFLLMYISNAPKYIIDSYVTDDEQAKINILLMVIYVVTLLSNFMFNPIINKLAVISLQKKYKELITKILVLCAGIGIIVVVGIIFAELIGRKLLGWIYKVSLEDYRSELLLIIIAGGLIALLNLFYMIIIMLRKQKIFYVVFTIATLILMIFGREVLIKFQFGGLCVFYNIILLVTSGSLMVYSLSIMCKKRRSND